MTNFLFLDYKITADGDCSHEIRQHLPLVRKAMTNPDSVLKSKGITLPTKVRIVKAMVFPVLIPFVRRLVWAGKPQLGNAAWGASFPSERALPAGGFGSVHTPSP